MMRQALGQVVAAVTWVHVAGAQQRAPGAESESYASFRGGFVARVGGGVWAKSQTVALPLAACAPDLAAPCAAGAKPIAVDIRFTPLPHPVELYKALATIGESMPRGRARYMVRPVPANQTSTICGAGMTLTEPMNNLRVTVNLTSAGPPLPVTCRWTVLGATENRQTRVGFDVVWSDTIAVRVVRRP